MIPDGGVFAALFPAPPGWDEKLDKEEDIVFMRYVGIGNVQDADEKAMQKRVPYSVDDGTYGSDYDAAAAVLERELKKVKK